MTDAGLTRRGLMGMLAWPLLAGVGQAAQPQLSGLVEPHMHIEGAEAGAPVVALTFDACDGHTDMRILNMLVDQGVSATIFASGLWLRGNEVAMKALLARPDLFEIGDHGAQHHAAIDRDVKLWGVRSCGSAAGIAAEVRHRRFADRGRGRCAAGVVSRGCGLLYARRDAGDRGDGVPRRGILDQRR